MKIKLTQQRFMKLTSLIDQTKDTVSTLIEGAGGDPTKVTNWNIVREQDGPYLTVAFPSTPEKQAEEHENQKLTAIS